MTEAKQANGDSRVVDLVDLIENAARLVKTAKKHHKPLGGDNFYGHKLAEMRSEAVNLMTGLSDPALHEIAEPVFSANADQQARLKAARDLKHHLRTNHVSSPEFNTEDALFPLSILVETKRKYLVTVGRQINGAFSAGWYDACAVMMRRLLETVIIEAYEGKKISKNAQNASGDYVQLTELVSRTISESGWALSRNAKKALPGLRDIGHKSAHSRRYTARMPDIQAVRDDFRLVIEEFVHLAGYTEQDPELGLN